MAPGRLTVVVGGQAGSEGKGAVSGKLCEMGQPRYAARVGGPNAGHTVIGGGGKGYALRQLPVAAVSSPKSVLIIAAGSEIDPDVLLDEINELEKDGYEIDNRLLVDREATIVEQRHKEKEGHIQTGTTAKGIGAARADRALRDVKRVAEEPLLEQWATSRTGSLMCQALEQGRDVFIEGTQGHHLGSHAGYFPYCTSGDCRAIDFLAACGIPPMEARVVVTLRTFPIRIAGNSGPLPNERSWEELGLDPEYTTVTKKMRRVGDWNWEWPRDSVEQNSAPGNRAEVALTFADYWWPDLAGAEGEFQRAELSDEIRNRLYEIEVRLNTRITMLGTGPDTQMFIDEETGDRA